MNGQKVFHFLLKPGVAIFITICYSLSYKSLFKKQSLYTACGAKGKNVTAVVQSPVTHPRFLDQKCTVDLHQQIIWD